MSRNQEFAVGKHGHEYELRYSGPQTITAYHIPSGKEVGKMEWKLDSGDPEYSAINHLEVDPKHQRKGIATAMWHYASSLANQHPDEVPYPEHDWHNMSPDAEKWAASMGHRPVE